LLSECHHWHPGWSFNDTMFWLLMILFHFGCILLGLVAYTGFNFLLQAGDEWLEWCTGSQAPPITCQLLPVASSFTDRLFSVTRALGSHGDGGVSCSRIFLLLFARHGPLTLSPLSMQTSRVSWEFLPLPLMAIRGPLVLHWILFLTCIPRP
jgi:hypothetical protein